MKNFDQLQEYYNHQLKDLYNTPYDQLTPDQLKKINKSISFKIWKLINRKSPMVTVIKRPAKY